jgi:MoxR-like ATPase
VNTTIPTVDEARTALQASIAWIKSTTLERDHIIDALAAAMVAGEHVLLIGSPGTAKSQLAEAFASALDARLFSNLGHRYQQPDEVLGPWDMRALQQENRWKRRTINRLPEAEIAFLDEVFKNSAALLNTLLGLINERRFENDGLKVFVPLRLVVGASNELPDERDGLGAFFDRFLVRFDVKRLVDQANVRAVLFGSGAHQPTAPARTSMEAIGVLAKAAETMPVDTAVQDSIVAIRLEMHAAGIEVSDRRWRKVVAYLKARAVIAGDACVTSKHLPAVIDCCWSRVEDHANARTLVEKNIAGWVRELMLADTSIDEQMARANDAANKSGSRTASITAMANVLDVAIEIQAAIAGIRVRDPAAATECDRIDGRVKQLQDLVQRGMAAQGISR